MKPDYRVDVIAMHESGGGLRPLRFRLLGDHQEYCRVDINRILDIRETSFAGVEAIVFLCRANYAGQERVFELRYHIRSHDWHLCRTIY